MMKKPLCIEETIEFTVNGLLHRLWIDLEEVPEILKEKEPFIAEFQARLKGRNIKESMEILSKVPNINAAQIKDRVFPEYGVMCYYVDF